MKKKLHTSLSKKKNSPFEKLFEWRSDERMWSPKDRAWYISYSLFFLVFIAMAALLEAYILMVAIIAFVFLWFTQAAVPPEKVTNTITSLGIKTYDKLFKWRKIKYFWFSYKRDVFFLNLDIVDEAFTSGNRVHRLALIIEEDKLEEVFNILVEFIEYPNKAEITYNFITQALNGTYLDVTHFLPDKNLTQEEFLKSKGKSLPEYEEEE